MERFRYKFLKFLAATQWFYLSFFSLFVLNFYDTLAAATYNIRAVNVCSLNNIVAESPLVLILFMKKKKCILTFFPASFFRKKKLEKKPNDGNGRKRKDR